MMLCGCRTQQNESTSQLIDDLQRSGRARTRAGAARILGARKAVQAVPALIGTLGDLEPNRLSAARALGRIRDPRAVEPLIVLLLTDFSPLVRQAAASALGDLKDPRAVVPLVSALKNGNPEAGPVLAGFGKAAVVPLADCLRDPEASTAAAAALVRIGRPAVSELIRVVESDRDYVRLEAARTLSQIDDPRTAGTLNSALGNGDLKLAAAAYPFLLRSGDQPSSQKLLTEALQTYGHPDMARDFCRSGNQAPKLAAKNWAYNKHYSSECEDSALRPPGVE